MPTLELSGCAVDDTRERRWTFWHWLGVASVVYVFPLVVLAVDAKFFQSRLDGLLGPEIRSVLDVVYWPIGKLGSCRMGD